MQLDDDPKTPIAPASEGEPADDREPDDKPSRKATTQRPTPRLQRAATANSRCG
jgi:hypothetical protein